MCWGSTEEHPGYIEEELGESILRESDDAGLVKTFIYAVPAANMAHPRLFRLYPVRENTSVNYKI